MDYLTDKLMRFNPVFKPVEHEIGTWNRDCFTNGYIVVGFGYICEVLKRILKYAKVCMVYNNGNYMCSEVGIKFAKDIVGKYIFVYGKKFYIDDKAKCELDIHELSPKSGCTETGLYRSRYDFRFRLYWLGEYKTLDISIICDSKKSVMDYIENEIEKRLDFAE